VNVTVDAASSTPPYEQLRAAIAAQALDGTLVAGARLPPVRALAAQLGLAANTVARAYRELEEAGVVETRGRNGTVVKAGDRGRARAQQAAQRYAQSARQLGLTVDEAIEYLRASY
jgi:DNA-binding transcriptional regulator YhcF (GntR family)